MDLTSAACKRHPELNFMSEDTAELRRCRDVCWDECPIRLQCLKIGRHEYAGCWGGHLPDAMKQINRRVRRGMSVEQADADFGRVGRRRQRTLEASTTQCVS